MPNRIGPSPVCVITLPSTSTAENRRFDQSEFKLQAESIIDRNLAKNTHHVILSMDPSKLTRPIFSSGINGDTHAAFEEMARVGLQQFRKIYVLAHGNEQGVENPKQRPDEPDQFTASALVEKFMTQGGLKEAVTKHVTSALLGEGRNDDRDFDLHIRLLSCRTGSIVTESGQFETQSADSYARDFLNLLVKNVKTAIDEVSSKDVERFVKANFRFHLTVSAPKGWNLVTKDGRCAVYDAPSSKEKAADEAVKKAYATTLSRAELYNNPRTQHYMVPRHDDRTRCQAMLEKYAYNPLTARVVT